MSGSLVESTDYYPITSEKCIIAFGILKHGIIRVQVGESRVITTERYYLLQLVNILFPPPPDLSMNILHLSVSEHKLNYHLFSVDTFQNSACASYLKSMVFDADAIQVSDIDI